MDYFKILENGKILHAAARGTARRDEMIARIKSIRPDSEITAPRINLTEYNRILATL